MSWGAARTAPSISASQENTNLLKEKFDKGGFSNVDRGSK